MTLDDLASTLKDLDNKLDDVRDRLTALETKHDGHIDASRAAQSQLAVLRDTVQEHSTAYRIGKWLAVTVVGALLTFATKIFGS